MRNPFLLLPLIAAPLAAQGGGGVDVIYSNIFSSAGHWSDSICIFDGNGPRPLASENTVRGSTGSCRKMKHRTINGRDYVYWLNITPSDAVFRATDRNGNGCFDASETETVFTFTNASQGQVDELGGKWCVSSGNSSAPDAGLWLLTDNNNDGDSLDSGESTQLIATSSMMIGATEISTDDIRACAFLPGGDIIWFDDDTRVWVRTTQAGVSTFFLGYGGSSSLNGTPPPPVNPDFGGSLPTFTNRFDRVSVDHSTGDVYIGVNFSSAAPYLFKCSDGNNDGDLNDTGEVVMFLDGLTTNSPGTGAMIRWHDDVVHFGGSVYLSHEIDTAADPGAEFLKLDDLNNDGDAMDTGEITVLGRTATTDDPAIIGIEVVPAGTFGTSCIDAEVQNDSELSIAGGTITFSFKDIQTSAQGASVVGICLLTFNGDAALTLPGPCTIGYTPGPLTEPSALVLQAGPPTGSTLSLPPLPYPPGLQPVAVDFVGLLIDTNGFQFVGYTNTGRTTPQ